jgi:hypothetical protein
MRPLLAERPGLHLPRPGQKEGAGRQVSGPAQVVASRRAHEQDHCPDQSQPARFRLPLGVGIPLSQIESLEIPRGHVHGIAALARRCAFPPLCQYWPVTGVQLAFVAPGDLARSRVNSRPRPIQSATGLLVLSPCHLRDRLSPHSPDSTRTVPFPRPPQPIPTRSTSKILHPHPPALPHRGQTRAHNPPGAERSPVGCVTRRARAVTLLPTAHRECNHRLTRHREQRRSDGTCGTGAALDLA